MDDPQGGRLAAAARRALLSAMDGAGYRTGPSPLLALLAEGHAGGGAMTLPAVAEWTAATASLPAKARRQQLWDAVAKLPRPAARRFFAGLGDAVRAALEEADDGEDGGAFRPSRTVADTLRVAALAVKEYVKGLSKTAAVAPSTGKRAGAGAQSLSLDEEPAEVARLLHDILFQLESTTDDSVREAQATILSMCEALWASNCRQRVSFIAQALPVLVVRAAASMADPTAAAADSGNDPTLPKQQHSYLKRLYAVREALPEIDFGDDSSRGLRRSLLALASAPVCLKSTEGVKLLAYLLQCDAILRNDLHLAVRAQIPALPRKQLVQIYGEVYFLAWKQLQAQEVEEDEEAEASAARVELEDLIGSYVSAMLHAKNPSLHKTLLNFLEPFHQQQKAPEVEDLLYRLYGPVLWRALAARNAQVRAQAAVALAQVFPLQESSHSRTAHAVEEACAALLALLQDKHPRVRAAGAAAVGRIHAEFWTVLPPPTIRSLLENHIIHKHASDASSALVRAAAVDAITVVLQNPQSHAALRPLLPQLGNLIHDKVEKVRLAVVRMLMHIKTIKGIKYHHVVPVEHLSARLARDGQLNLTGPVASGLTGLMANAYFPPDGAMAQAQRALVFLRRDPAAARVFYANVAQHITVPSVARLMAMLFECLRSAVRTEQAAQATRSGKGGGQHGGKRRRFGGGLDTDADASDSSSDADDNEGDESLLSAADTPSMVSLVGTINTLWRSIEGKLSSRDHRGPREYIAEKFSVDALTEILTHFEQKARKAHTQGDDSKQEDCHRVCADVLQLLSRLQPSGAIDELVLHISSVLSSLSDAGESSHQVTGYLSLLCLWGMTDQVASALASSIESAFERDHAVNYESLSSLEHSRKRRVGVRSDKSNGEAPVIPELGPVVALTVLGDILSGSDPTSIAARESLFQSSSAMAVIEKVLLRATRQAERVLAGNTLGTMNEDEMNIILRACEMYGRCALHRAAIDGGSTFNENARRLLDWTSKRVVPAFSLSQDDIGFDDFTVAVNSMNGSPMSPEPTGPARRRTNRNRTPNKEPDTPSDQSTPGCRDKEASIIVARAFATSLLQASCVIFSEWLAVGCAGAEEIAGAATVWVKVFCIEEIGSVAQNDLVPAFSRLALQLAKHAENYSLLEGLLIECKDNNKNNDKSLENIVCLLCNSRNPTTILLLVKVVYSAALDAADSENFMMSDKRPTSIGELCSGSIKSALSVITNCKQARLELIRVIVGDLNHQTGYVSENLTCFKALMLSLLNNLSVSIDHVEALDAIRGLAFQAPNTDGETESALKGLIDGILA